MAQEELNKQISELHKALANTTAVEPETQKLLAELEEHIRPMVEESEEADHTSLAERLEGSLAHFEIDHPILTMHIRTVIGTLSNMGL